jgi:hypothetical protein
LQRLGHTIREIDLPDLPYGATVGVIVDAECASAFEDIIRDGRAKQLRAKQDQIGGFEAAATLAIDYLRAQRIRAKIRQALLSVSTEWTSSPRQLDRQLRIRSVLISARCTRTSAAARRSSEA